MRKENVEPKLKQLAQRALIRKRSYPSMKSASDVKVENDNFVMLESHIYKNISEEG